MNSFNELIKGSKPVLVDFFAEWCGPCKMMKPELERLKGMIGEKAVVVKVDVDRNQSAAQAYNIRSVPTMAIFRNGRMEWKHSGVMRADDLHRVLLNYC